MFVQNFKILGAVISEKSLPKNFIRGKEKWINKGNDKHEDADSVFVCLCWGFTAQSTQWGHVIHDTSSSTQSLYQISKS